jgi:hypothetical protein
MSGNGPLVLREPGEGLLHLSATMWVSRANPYAVPTPFRVASSHKASGADTRADRPGIGSQGAALGSA